MNDKNIDEIDLIFFLKKIYKKRKFIGISTFLFIIIGIVVALTKPEIYSSATTFIPQNQETKSSGISGVASLVGINLGGGFNSTEIPPSMYPEIKNSAKFKRKLLNSIIDSKSNITLEKFIINYYDISETKEINDNLMFVSKSEEKIFEIISNMIIVSVNENDGFISISSEMPNAEYSAVIVRNAKNILQDIIIENRIESARQTLNFSLKQLSEKKAEFDEIQTKLAYFKDSNLNIVNSVITNEQDKLEAEFEIINAVVTELSKQVEQAKLQVNKETPVFSTLNEPTIPNIRSSPKRKQIVLIYGFIGLLISIGYILFIDYVRILIKEIIN